jgi:hypothetical protein
VIRASTGEKLTDNKINAGRYVQPALEYLFPEANVPGIMPPVNDFKNFPFLAQGLGYDSNGDLFGQLNPWPGASAPAPRSCGPYSPPAATSAPASSAASSPASFATDAATVVDPSASASSTPVVAVVATQTTRPGVVFNLGFNVTNSAEFIANDLVFSWTQVEGPTLTLSDSTVKATYVYNIKVSSTKRGTSGNANVTVVSDPLVKDIVTIESYTSNSSNGGSISVKARTNIVGYKAGMKVYVGSSATGTATILDYQGNGVYGGTIAKAKPIAAGIFVLSDAGGSKGLTTKTS